MQRFFGIPACLFLLFVALPTQQVLACGENHEQIQQEVGDEKALKEAASCDSEKLHTCEDEHPGKECPTGGGCCGNGCNCPCGALAGGHSSVLPIEILIISDISCTATLRQAFYFAQHMPQEVYLAIWQPPQLSV